MNSDSDKIKISVVIVSWNARDFLMQCLASLSPDVCQYPMEVIVVDNASSDGSPESVKRLFPQTLLICNSTNLGFAKANNIGIRECNGKYICLANSDIQFLPGCITKLVQFCEAHPEVGMVGPRIIGKDGKTQLSCRRFPTVWNMFCRALALDSLFPNSRLLTSYSQTWTLDVQCPVDILSGCFWLVRKEVLKTVGVLDESFFMYGEDMDWCKRFWASGSELAFVPSSAAIHYGGASSANAPIRFYIERQRADLQYWRKHHSLIALTCYYIISLLYLTLRISGYSLALLVNRNLHSTFRYRINRSFACLRWMITGRVPVT